MHALDEFIRISNEEWSTRISHPDEEALMKAAALIEAARARGGRLHITGIGKPSHVANYAASLFSSTGTPTYYLHATEAVHGSCGQLAEGDVVICISNSGETAELKATVEAVRNNGCQTVAVTGAPESWLAKHAEVCLLAGVCHEGGPLDRAPRTSVLAEMFVLQCLSVILQAHADLTPEQYVRRHPGGMLGRLRPEEQK